jgi:hypothetical protein
MLVKSAVTTKTTAKLIVTMTKAAKGMIDFGGSGV